MACFKTRPGERARGSAFTLVEMLLVLSLIGILAGATVVSFRGRQERDALARGAEDLAQALRYAHEETRIRDVPHRIVFGEGGKEYRVEIQVEGSGEFVPARGLAGRPRKLFEGVRLSGFSSDGKSFLPIETPLLFEPGEVASVRVLRLETKGSESRRVEILAVTGQVEVVEER